MDPTALDQPAAAAAVTQGKRRLRLGRARLAVALMFFVNGAVVSNWAPRIPQVQHHLGISNGELGLALLGTSAGAMTAMPLAGWLATRFGSRPVITTAVLALCLALPLPALATSAATLGLALFVFGMATGSLDVSMNAQAVEIQRRMGRPILSSFHALFSFGALVGAATGGLAAGIGLSPLHHFLIAGAVCGVIALFGIRRLLPPWADKTRPHPSGRRRRGFVRPSRRLLALGIIGFCCLLAEGAVSDWSAVYLKGSLNTGAGFAAAGFAAFSLTMTVFRLLGDRLTMAWGPVSLLRRGGLLVAVSLGIALIVANPILAVVGFAGVGVGLAAMVPVVFSAASASPNQAAGTAIAAVSTIGYMGLLVGPPLIGVTSEYLTLTGGLTIIVIMGLLTALLAGAARTADP